MHNLGRDITYLGARLQMGKGKGRREGDDGTSGGDIGSRRGEYTKEKVKKKTLESEHNKATTKKNNIEDPEESTLCSLSNNMGDYKGACDSRCSAA